MNQVSEELCQSKSTKCLQAPLKSTEQIFLVILIPAIVNCIVYVIHFSADLVVAIQHFREENSVWGYVTIGFIYSPAFAYFILTTSRPDWWMTDDDKLHRGTHLWFLIQITKLIAFPLFALYRYASLIVLSIDATIVTGEYRRKTLNIATAPAAIELYFFLQAWLQAAPQAIFQTYLLFRERHISRTYQSEAVHVLCILMSVCSVSIKTTLFQRYETQRINGKKVPWAMWLKKYRFQELENLEKKQLLQSRITPLVEVIENSQLETNDNKNTSVELQNNLEHQNSLTPPLPPKNIKVIPPPMPLRGITSITPLPVPDMQAPPRPDSTLVNDNIKVNEFSKSLETTINTKEFERNNNPKISRQNIFVKGLENDDPLRSFVSFLWWFLFIFSRVLSIGIFLEFYPIQLLIVLSIHYVSMIAYLFYYAKYYDITNFFINLWLGLVYIFSLIEYRVKFKYADKWILFYYTFVILQNTLITIWWYFYSNWEGFWYLYSFHIIFICMSLCLLTITVYYLFLKQKKQNNCNLSTMVKSNLN